MGKGRDKRRRNAKRKDEVRPVKAEVAKAQPMGGETLGPIDPYAAVLAPLKPRPSLRSGAVALPEPTEPLLTEAIGVKHSK
jgi:hypothetical protein